MFRLFDFSLWIKGFPIQKAKAELQSIVCLSEAEHRLFTEDKKQEIAEFHLKQNSFYRELAGSDRFERWEKLPVLTKQQLQRPLIRRISKGYALNKIYVNKTSGSSGHPFVFAKDKYSHALTWASNIYRFGWFGIDFNTSFQARFYGIPLDTIGYYKERIKDFLAHRYRFPIFDLSDSVLERFLTVFRAKRFDYINGYTSSIVLFAKFLQKKGLVLKDICPTLKVCIVTSEMLFPQDKILLERQFGVPVVNEYGASELDLIAFQNPDGEWQVNAETLFVEILDADGNAVPNGEEGRIVITSLYNKAHPFIRYDIGDIGVLDQAGTLQKPILKKLTGRTNDVAFLPSGKTSPGLTFYYITKSIIEDDGNVREFIIKQTATDAFEIHYVSEVVLDESKIVTIEKAIAVYLESGLNFTFIRKTFLERSHRGKLKQFSSLI